MAGEPEVRLELTWPNKELFLLTPRDAASKPLWVTRDHPASKEVRLTADRGTIGETNATSKSAQDNLLVTGDSLDFLRILAEHPDYWQHYRGQIQCIYIDPPFNTGQTFADYDDWMEHSTWLSFMRDRLVLMKDLLSPTGSIWVHLDNAEIHRMRCLMDEIMGAGTYLGTAIWQRTSAKSLAKRTMGTMHEAILIYGGSVDAELNTLYLPHADEYIAKRYTQSDENGPYDTGDLTATSYRPHLDSGKPWRGFDPSSLRRCWAVPRAPLLSSGLTEKDLANLTMREKLDILADHNLIHFPKDDGFPRIKKYLSNTKGRAVGDLWTDINVINSQAGERTGFSTQKPEQLLQRVLAMATSKAEHIVLDCFAGSGTTAAVATKMGRRWVTSEISQETIEKYIVPRLTQVVEGTDDAGITKAEGWSGGGGFRQLSIQPSLYEVMDDGTVLLSDRAANGTFAAAVAANLDFEYQPNSAPLCGRRGRMRLAVLDGIAGPEEVRSIVSALNADERVKIVAKVVMPEAEKLLASISRGSRLEKAPRDLLKSRRRRQRKVVSA